MHSWVALMILVMVSACIGFGAETESQQVVCNPPYIRMGLSCCLDRNSNGVCDIDEQSTSTSSTTLNLPLQVESTSTVTTSSTLSESTSSTTSTSTTSSTVSDTPPSTVEVTSTTLSPSYCGDGVCESTEALTCCDDCGCGGGKFCGSDNKCHNNIVFKPFFMEFKLFDRCGNGICGSDEDSISCCTDCGCSSPLMACVNNTCVSRSFQLKPVIVTPIVTGGEIEISEGGGNFMPRIDGDKVVWAKYYSGKPDIVQYEISTGVFSKITDDEFTQDLPFNHGDYIVWQDYRRPSSKGDVYLLNTKTGFGGFIAPKERIQHSMSIFGEKIVWIEEREDSWNEVYMFDMSTSTEKRLTNNNRHKHAPAIWGDWVVWSEFDWQRQKYNVQAFRISNGVTTTVVEGAYDISEWVGLHQDKLVYTYGPIGGRQVYLHDLNSKITHQITTAESNKYGVKIHGNRIIWLDNRGGNYDIHLYDIGTSQEKKITNNSASESSLDISGNTIVYERKAKIYKYLL